MADTLTFYDLEFHFTSGPPLSVTVQDGVDTFDDSKPNQLKVTVKHDDRETTFTIHTDKLNAVQSTKRIEKKQLSVQDVIEDAFSAHQDV